MLVQGPHRCCVGKRCWGETGCKGGMGSGREWVQERDEEWKGISAREKGGRE